jgi:3-oxoacyl-[acyl-carrier protein] reductase
LGKIERTFVDAQVLTRRAELSQETKPLAGKVVLVTGGTRGIGKALSVRAAQLGANVVVNYRDPGKLKRAQSAVSEIEVLGANVLLVQADVTEATDRQNLFAAVKEKFGKLDALILNAAGGLEQDKGDDYAMRINRDSQIALIKEALAAGLMAQGGVAVYMTSLWAHRYGAMEQLPGYEPVARTKHAAETALRDLQPELSRQGVKIAYMVGHLITDTAAFLLFKRKDKALVEQLTSDVEGGVLPSTEDVAVATLDLLTLPNLESGFTIYVGKPKDA